MVKITKERYAKLADEGKVTFSTGFASGNPGNGWIGTYYTSITKDEGKYYQQDFYLADGEWGEEGNEDYYYEKEEVEIEVM